MWILTDTTGICRISFASLTLLIIMENTLEQLCMQTGHSGRSTIQQSCFGRLVSCIVPD